MPPTTPPPDDTGVRRWRRVRELFDAALDLAGTARDAWLTTAMASDPPSVATEVRAMLAADAGPAPLLDSTPTALFAGAPRAAEVAPGDPIALLPQRAPAAGSRVGPYLLDREVGRGGMGAVWSARRADVAADGADAEAPDVAVKLLAVSGGPLRAAERFAREARLGTRLAHPHLVPVLDAGVTADGVPWFAMPFVRGETLHARMARAGRLTARDALRLTTQLADALAHAHAQGVVHRDVKPGNVIVDAAGDAHLVDFGIARALDAADPEGALTLTGTVVGSPRYLSPERAGGAPPDGRDDVWALGCILYELLTGVPPYRGAAHARLLAGRPAPPLRRSATRVPTCRRGRWRRRWRRRSPRCARIGPTPRRSRARCRPSGRRTTRCDDRRDPRPRR